MKKTLLAENVHGCWKGGENVLLTQKKGDDLFYVNQTWTFEKTSMPGHFCKVLVSSMGHLVGFGYSRCTVGAEWCCWFHQQHLWTIHLDIGHPVMNIVGDKFHLWSLLDGNLTRYVISLDTGIIDSHTVQQMTTNVSRSFPITKYIAEELNDHFFAAGAGEDDEMLLYRIMDDGELVPSMSNILRSHNIERVKLGRRIHMFFIIDDDHMSLMAVRVSDEKILWEMRDLFCPFFAMDDREKYFFCNDWVPNCHHWTMHNLETGQLVWEFETPNFNSRHFFFYKDSTELLVVEIDQKAYSIAFFASQKKALQSLLFGIKTSATIQRILRGHLFVF